METTNWIEKIKETVRIAMNKGLEIGERYQLKCYIFTIEDKFEFFIHLDSNSISIRTKKGYLSEKYLITDRDDLELRALMLSIKEYNTDIATSELDEFITENSEVKTITDINSLDDDE